MPHFTDAERPGGVQRLRNVEELIKQTSLEPRYATEVTAWMVLMNFPHGFSVLKNGNGP